ncbi:MAG TPA: hypothetical protein VMH90_00220 [Thermoplasmata archaeon]|nr:hypothetical protein [Thermoplasmata archaeon]
MKTPDVLGPAVFDPPDGPPVSPAPGSGASTARYVYLLSRLRGRQITMEEATELFAIQQAMIRSSASAPPPPPPPPPPGGSSGGTGPGGVRALGEDADWVMFLGLGMGAGLAAALMKRLGGPPPTKSPATPPASP